jgi:drug/metabolite transporter (DMT)-like permease
MIWIILAAAGAPLQVARNATQRGLVGDAGPWGATLVRFLFGLPFALSICAIAWTLAPGAAPHLSWRFALGMTTGALAQIGATGTLLTAMRRAGFAVATVMQQASLPFAALFGWVVLGDRLGTHGIFGVALTTAGLAIVSWPRRDQVHGLGALLGLVSGAAFAISLNAYREAGRALDPLHPLFSGTATVCVAQAFQSVLLVTGLAVTRPAALGAVLKSWRASLGAGFFGAAASACWFAALALAPASSVRAVGTIEVPISAVVGRRLFREGQSFRQLAGGALASLGVILTAFG